jgi:lipopolysaccharide/colanic/teichoic acid biosynthesis glycosyltransferase
MIFPTFLRRTVLLIGDIVLYYLALIITLIIRFGNSLSPDILKQHLIPFSIILPIWLICLGLLDGYNLKSLREKRLLFIKIIILCIFGSLFTGLFFYIFTLFEITPKTNLAIFAIYFGLFVLIERLLVLRVFSNYLQNRIAFIGETPEVYKLIEIIESHPQLGWKNAGFINESNFSAINEKQKIDVIVVANEEVFKKEGEKFFYQLFPLKVNFLDLPTAYERIARRVPINSVDPKWFLATFKEGRMQVFDKLKRVFDIIFAIFVLVLTCWLWPIIAISIKLEDGKSIFFLQKRMSKDFKKFLLYKFRTMEESKAETQPWTSGRDDPRITKVGKILRFFHLDELPQMINILKGDISVVGPRPESLETIAFLEKHIPYYHLRHLIKPGFTGWAQIGMSDPKEAENLSEKDDKIKFDFRKVEFDLYYIKNRSFFLDAAIIVQTMDLVLKQIILRV